MNEEALRSIYSDLGFEGEGVSFEDFTRTMSSNEEARKSVFDDLGLESEGVSYDNFTSTLGFNQPQEIENKELESKVLEAVDDGKLTNVLNNIGNTAQNIGNSLAITIDRLSKFSNPASAVTEAVSLAATGELIQSPIEKRLAQYVDENNEQIEVNTIARSYDPEKSFEENVEVAQQGIIDTFQKDGAVAGLGEVGIKTAESIPYLITSLLTGGVGGAGLTAGTFFGTGYGNSIAEQRFEEGGGPVNEAEALMKGTVEGVTSILFGGISRVGRDAMKSIGKEEAKRIIGNNVKEQLKLMTKEGAKGAAGEGFEEAFQEVANYAIDSYYGDEKFNPERAFKIGLDALILGSAAGGPIGSAGAKYKFMRAKAVNDKSIAAVDKELENQSTKDNPVKQDYLEKKKASSLSKISSPDDVSAEDAAALDKLYYDKQDLEKAIESTQDKDLREDMVKDLEKNQEETQSILDKYEGDNTGPGSDQGSDGLDVRSESTNEGSDNSSGTRAGGSDSRTSSGTIKESDGIQRDATTTLDGGDGKGNQGDAVSDSDVVKRVPRDELSKFSKESRVEFSFVGDSKMKKNKSKKVNTLDVLGVDQGEISVGRAQQLIKKNVKKYEALIKCLG